MEVYSPASRRLWRPAAQRQVRNAWSAIAGHRAAWTSASSAGLSAATSLVNCYLHHSYMDAVDLGVLSDMAGIRDKARAKLKEQQEAALSRLIRNYEALVAAVGDMAQASKSMRTYLKSSDGPIIGFGQQQVVDGDVGDGAGVPVFQSLTLHDFENLAATLLYMYQCELKIKWILVSEFQAVLGSGGQGCAWTIVELPDAQQGQEQQKSDEEGKQQEEEAPERSCSVDDDAETWRLTLDKFQQKRTRPPERQVLEVYLTAWLAEAHIRKKRIDGILDFVNDEMGVTTTTARV